MRGIIEVLSENWEDKEIEKMFENYRVMTTITLLGIIFLTTFITLITGSTVISLIIVLLAFSFLIYEVVNFYRGVNLLSKVWKAELDDPIYQGEYLMYRYKSQLRILRYLYKIDDEHFSEEISEAIGSWHFIPMNKAQYERDSSFDYKTDVEKYYDSLYGTEETLLMKFEKIVDERFDNLLSRNASKRLSQNLNVLDTYYLVWTQKEYEEILLESSRIRKEED